MKKAPLFTVIAFCATLVCFGLWFWILPDRALSKEENRPLQTLPKFQFTSLLTGRFSGELSDYYADQFPLRDQFVRTKAILELSLGKNENDGILLGENGRLARRLFRLPQFLVPTDVYDREALSQKATAIKEFCNGAGIPVSILLPARAIDIAASSFSYPKEESRALLSQLQTELSKTGYGELNERLREAHERGEPVWYKTDHHWTSLGAYYAYVEVMRSFGMEDEAMPLESFNVREVSNSFYGTLASASGIGFVEADRVELFLSGCEEDYEVIADGKALPGFYSMDALAGKDHYAVFLDGTHGVVTVRKKSGEERPLLLVAKDSFANSMAPFLALHFDLILVNLSSTRQDFTNLSAALEKYRPDRLLLVYSVENLLTSDRILNLR